jgi:hypothetical protein
MRVLKGFSFGAATTPIRTAFHDAVNFPSPFIRISSA